MSMENGVMKMRPLEKGLTIEPAKTVKLAPAGNHLMMMDLKQPLKRGDKVPVTLEMERHIGYSAARGSVAARSRCPRLINSSNCAEASPSSVR
jgi:hypothetical protein